MELLKKIINKINPQYNFTARGSEFEVNNWVLSRFIVNKVIPVVGVEPFPLSELLLMTSAVAWSKPTHIFEWGTHVGKSARIFLETCRFLKLDTQIHSIDLPDDVDHVEHPHHIRGKLVKHKKNVTLHQGDGVTTALNIYGSLPKNSTALFYVDGDHSYNSVSRELNSIIQEVANPFVLLHDTFYQSKESGYNIGPTEAIDHVLQKHPAKKFRRINTNTGLPGMTFLYLPQPALP